MKSSSFRLLGFRWGGPIAIVLALSGGVLWFFWGLPSKNIQTVQATTLPAVLSDEPIQPIELAADLNPSKIELGRQLFNDPQLSSGNQLACSQCHNLQTGGTDRRVHPVGVNGAAGVINTPTVLNSGLSFSQFWDGHASTLEDQLDGPIQSKIEMGSSWPEVIGKLQNSPAYAHAFHQVYGGTIKKEQVKDSLAEFERSLATPNSAFDRYLRHQAGALSDRQKQGYQLFKSFGCASCHQGAAVGGNMYQKLGVMAPYFTDRGGISVADRGRFNVTGDPNDMYMFKVPSLRNVQLTAPYFHDGRPATLPEAVRLMAKYQLGRRLTPDEVDLIVDFLNTLTGELNGKPL